MQVQVQDVGFGYSPFPHELARDPGVSLQAKGLFAVYGSFVSVGDPTAWPSENYLCKLCGGINVKTLRKYKGELLAQGWISQQQRQKENGQYTTLLVTRYYHPSMNPFFSIKSTVDQKTDGGKTDDRKLVPQEQKPIPITKKHTQTKACVSDQVSQEQRECIEWTIQEMKRKNTLGNEVAIRCYLVKAAMNGQLLMDEYRRCAGALERAKRAEKEVLSKVDSWKKEVEGDPVDWEEQKRLHPGLFR